MYIIIIIHPAVLPLCFTICTSCTKSLSSCSCHFHIVPMYLCVYLLYAGKQPSLKVLTLSFQCLLEAVPALQCHMEWCSAEQAATSKDSLSCMHLSEDTWRMFTRKLQNVLKDLTAVSSRTKRYVLHAAHFAIAIVL